MGAPVVTVTIGADPPDRLDKALARDVPEAAHLSRSRLARLISDGSVSQDGDAVLNPKHRVKAGDVYEIVVEEASPTDILPEAIPLVIVHEDDDVIVIDKPAGMVVHPAPGSPRGTVVNALLAHLGDALSGVGGRARPGIVHRIDKDTSGLLVVAKTDRAHHALAEQFAAHEVHRRYRALCHGVPDPGDPRLVGLRGVGFETGGAVRIATHLARHKTDRQRQAVMKEGGKHAVTRVWVEARFGQAAAEIVCQLETGRTHQIRVHLAYIGHGLIGDPVYGSRRRFGSTGLPSGAADAANAFPRQALHAAELGFAHPYTGMNLQFTSKLPADMTILADALRGDAQ
ncbi:MAG: pseudouridine synthase [Pseudomonadota bacterium]